MDDAITDELAGTNLGHTRLNERCLKVMQALAADPQASINAACGGWAETFAADRVFNNVLVTPEMILQSHREATLQRIRQSDIVIVAQDTTKLDLTNHPPRNAHCLNRDNRFGGYQHLSLVLTLDKLPLGGVATSTFDRAPSPWDRLPNASGCPSKRRRPFGGCGGFGRRMRSRPPAPTHGSSASPIAKRTSMTSLSKRNRIDKNRVARQGRRSLWKQRRWPTLSFASSWSAIPSPARTPFTRCASRSLNRRCCGRSRWICPRLRSGTRVSWFLITSLPIETLDAVLKVVAELADHNNRATDRAPGPQCLWQGLRRVIDFA